MEKKNPENEPASEPPAASGGQAKAVSSPVIMNSSRTNSEITHQRAQKRGGKTADDTKAQKNDIHQAGWHNQGG